MGRGLFVVLVVVVLVAAACAKVAGSRSAAPSSSTASTTTVAPPSVAPTSPGTAAAPTSLPPVTPPGTTAAVVVHPYATPRAKTIDASLRTPDGRTRTYHLYVPSTVSTSGPAVPLLVALHGGVGWGTQFEKNSGFDGLAEANRFVVVYPDGIGSDRVPNAFRTWNAGACCGPAARHDVDDVGFVRLLIAHLKASYPIDPARVFVAGHSNGGMLGYRIACELSDEVAAVGVQSSTLEIPACHPSRPVSFLHIHGTADQNVPITGGKGTKAISGVSYPRPIDSVTTLARANGCTSPPSVVVDPTNPDITIHTWTGCAGGSTVRFEEVKGAPHAWMGHKTAVPKAVGVPYARLDSSVEIWTFLVNHPRPAGG